MTHRNDRMTHRTDKQILVRTEELCLCCQLFPDSVDSLATFAPRKVLPVDVQPLVHFEHEGMKVAVDGDVDVCCCCFVFRKREEWKQRRGGDSFKLALFFKRDGFFLGGERMRARGGKHSRPPLCFNGRMFKQHVHQQRLANSNPAV